MVTEGRPALSQLAEAIRAALPRVGGFYGEMSHGDAQALADALQRDFLIIQRPDCGKEGGHGAHTMMTRSVRCPGVEPIPHGYAGSHMGSFGMIVRCRCGHNFSDYRRNPDDGPTAWTEHQAEHGIEADRAYR